MRERCVRARLGGVGTVGAAGAVAALLLAAGCSGGSPGKNVPTETWTATLTGTAVGPFVCLTGTDGWYDESASVPFDVAGSLVSALRGSASVDYAGTFSGVETANENSGGTGCAPQPSVVSTTRPATPVTVRELNGQLEVLSSSVVLMPAHFSDGGMSWALDSTKLVLEPTSVGDAEIDGTWYAVAWSYGSPVSAQGTFVLRNVASAPPPPTSVTAHRGAGEVAVSWAASPTATSYRVYWRTSPGVTPANGAVASGIAATTTTIGGLTAGTTYYFVVTAVNSAGESAPSAEVSATPAAAGTAISEIFALTGSKLQVFPRTASGNVVPARSITGLSALRVSVDGTNSEVATVDASGVVRFYALGASGSATPLRTLDTGIGYGYGVRVDPVNDEVAVTDGTYVHFFARTATGSAAPLRRLQVVVPDGSGATPPYVAGFFVDTVNDELLAVTGLSTAAPVTVQVFSRTAIGAATPLRTLTASAPVALVSAGVAVDTANDELWVTYTSYTSATQVFARTASGSATPLRSSSLAGAGLYVDPAHDEVGVEGGSAIQVISRTTLGSLRTITGASTGLTTISGVDGGP